MVLPHQVIGKLRVEVFSGEYEKLKCKRPKKTKIVWKEDMVDSGAQMVVIGQRMTAKLGVR